MNTASFFHIIEQIVVLFGLFIFLAAYCGILWKFNRLPWFRRVIFKKYHGKSAVHWEKKKNHIKWNSLLFITLILSLWGLINVGLNQLTDPYSVIVLRTMSNSQINTHLTVNLIVFGSLGFIVFRTVVPFEIINMKRISYILLVFAVLNSCIIWIPNILNHSWYLENDQSLSVLQIIIPSTPENIGPNGTVGNTTIGPTGMGTLNYIASYFNLIASSLQSFAIFIIVVGSIKNQEHFKQVHKERLEETRNICLEKLVFNLERETVGIYLSSEEIMTSCFLSLDETHWILTYYDQRYPGSWYPTMNFFRHREDVITNINNLISELKEGE